MVTGSTTALDRMIVQFDADFAPFRRKLDRALRDTDVLARRFQAATRTPSNAVREEIAGEKSRESRVLREAEASLAASVKKAVELLGSLIVERILKNLFADDTVINSQLFARPLDPDRLAKAHRGLGEVADRLEREAEAFKAQTTVTDEVSQQKLDRAGDLRRARDAIVGVLAAERERLRREFEALERQTPGSAGVLSSVIEDLKRLERVLREIAQRVPGLVEALGLDRASRIPPFVPPAPAKPARPGELMALPPPPNPRRSSQRAAAVDAYEAQAARWRELLTGTDGPSAGLAETAARARALEEAAREAGRSLAEALSEAVFGGKKLSEVLGDLERRLKRALGRLARDWPDGLERIFAPGPLELAGAFLAPGFQSGGPVVGPGGALSDRVPAWLSPGEYVVNAKAAGRHRRLLDLINRGALPRALRDGEAIATDPAQAGRPAGRAAPVVNVTINVAARAQAREVTRSLPQIRAQLLETIREGRGREE